MSYSAVDILPLELWDYIADYLSVCERIRLFMTCLDLYHFLIRKHPDWMIRGVIDVMFECNELQVLQYLHKTHPETKWASYNVTPLQYSSLPVLRWALDTYMPKKLRAGELKGAIKRNDPTIFRFIDDNFTIVKWHDRDAFLISECIDANAVNSAEWLHQKHEYPMKMILKSFREWLYYYLRYKKHDIIKWYIVHFNLHTVKDEVFNDRIRKPLAFYIQTYHTKLEHRDMCRWLIERWDLWTILSCYYNNVYNLELKVKEIKMHLEIDT